ncbi:MAG TPA: hypothetical protein VFZ65_18465 [Planctomycetota bacterium]|nr:hypothetical protein [Planctomycetota bacterium]
MTRLPAFLMLVPLACARAQQPGADEFARQLAAIVPVAEELAWQLVPWRSEFRTALVEANRLDKPVLLWAMNGHPLGQT